MTSNGAATNAMQIRIAEIKKNCEMAIKFGSHGNAMQAVREDVPFLLDLIDKQARALEQSKTALEHALELDCFTPGGSTEMLAKDAITAIDEVLK